MEKKLRVYFDSEGDFLEVAYAQDEVGYFKDAGDDLFLRINRRGEVMGFALFNASKRRGKTVETELPIKATFTPA